MQDWVYRDYGEEDRVKVLRDKSAPKIREAFDSAWFNSHLDAAATFCLIDGSGGTVLRGWQKKPHCW